jgi:hypothetical protein
MTQSANLTAFQVPTSTHLLSGFVHRHPRLWTWLGNLESHSLRGEIDPVPIDRPIYVAGLARAGTTILLELLSRHPDVATHQYRDFPGQFVPLWWNRGRKSVSSPPRERAHGDGLTVTEHSPEAMEEAIWMAFFDSLHDPRVNNIFDHTTSNLAFEGFYRDHIRKLLLARQRNRYVAKGNYNFTRFPYLRRLFPDAKFVAVIRHPRQHIASLIKEQRLFCAGETEYPRALAHMQRVGHFEFGFDRRAINVGDGVAEQVHELWQRGEEIRGTARYWASLYGWFANLLERDAELATAVQVVRYEDLCGNPHDVTASLLAHCELETSTALTEFAGQIRPPTYYKVSFTDAEDCIIAEETEAIAQRFSYASALCSEPLAV